MQYGAKTAPVGGCFAIPELVVDGGLLQQQRPVFGGKAHACCQGPGNHPRVTTVREGAVDPAECDDSRTGETVGFPVVLDAADMRTRLFKKEKGKP